MATFVCCIQTKQPIWFQADSLASSKTLCLLKKPSLKQNAFQLIMLLTWFSFVLCKLWFFTLWHNWHNSLVVTASVLHMPRSSLGYQIPVGPWATFCIRFYLVVRVWVLCSLCGGCPLFVYLDLLHMRHSHFLKKFQVSSSSGPSLLMLWAAATVCSLVGAVLLISL